MRDMICTLLCLSLAFFTHAQGCLADIEPPVANCPSPAAGMNILNNFSFESNGGHNTPFGSEYGPFGAVFTLDANLMPVNAKDGDYFLKMFGAVSGVTQSHPMNAGETVTATVDIMNASFDPMLPGCFGLAKVEFYNAGGGKISEVEGNKIFHTNPSNIWTPSTVTAVAPAGTASVLYVAVMVCSGGGAVMFDNATMSIDDGSAPGADFILNSNLGQCGAIFDYTIPDPTDNCNATSVADIPSGSLFDVGTNVVTVTATDDAGNSSTCTFNVIVNDIEDPIANCPTLPDGSNILNNFSFENNNGHDTPFNISYGPFGAVFVLDANLMPVDAKDGDYFLKMFGAVSGVTQDHPVTSGQSVTASVDIMNASFDPMLPGCFGLAKVEFYNSSGAKISEVEGNKIFHTNPQNEWTTSSITATAPAGAVSVKYVAVMVCSAGGAVMFDNASLSINGNNPGDFTIDYDPDLCMATVSFTIPPASDNCPGPVSMASPPSGTMLPVGQNTITVTAMDASGNSSSCAVNVTVEAPLPCGYDSATIGCAGDEAASYDDATGTFSLTSDNCTPGFPYIGDSQSFIFTELCGNGYIKALVDNVNGNGFAGIQMRDDLMQGAKKVDISTNMVNRLGRSYRFADNYPAYPQEIYSLDKFWLKIERTGNVFRAYASADDVTYIPYLYVSIQMGACLEVGMFVYSKNSGVVEANFSNVEVVPTGMNPLESTPNTMASSNAAIGLGLTPNPARDLVSLNLDQIIGEAATISIFNMNGQMIEMIQYDSIEDANEEINISDLPVGTYYISVRTASSQETLKLIKQ